jgi:PPK2 family polyphosphate:nucleotide phosphotransferase
MLTFDHRTERHMTLDTSITWRVPPGTTVRLKDYDPGDTGGFSQRQEAEPAAAADLTHLRDLQERLYVNGRYAVLLILQGMDTAGKDGMVRYLSQGVELMGAEVTSFKQPTATELAHDFLWRIHQRTPEHGKTGIFNRSHYEDVLIVRVHNLVPPNVWEKRYDQINAFEKILADNDTIIIKCFLHISKSEQRDRLMERLDEPAKRWKFNPGDLKERLFWDQYQDAYEAALTRCNTDYAPWYIIPSNKKWFRNFAVTRILVQTLQSLDLSLPEPAFDLKDISIT